MVNTFRMKKWQYKYWLKIFSSIFLAKNEENVEANKKEKNVDYTEQKIKRL